MARRRSPRSDSRNFFPWRSGRMISTMQTTQMTANFEAQFRNRRIDSTSRGTIRRLRPGSPPAVDFLLNDPRVIATQFDPESDANVRSSGDERKVFNGNGYSQSMV